MIRVGDSPGKGRGIFATRNIREGELIEDGPVVVMALDQVPHLDATALCDYYFLWGEDETEAAVLFGLCSLCNHSYKPNARFRLNLERKTIAFVALRDIAAGEEITTNYNGEPGSRKELWFKTSP